MCATFYQVRKPTTNVWEAAEEIEPFFAKMVQFIGSPFSPTQSTPADPRPPGLSGKDTNQQEIALIRCKKFSF